jgi:hypothetical protein
MVRPRLELLLALFLTVLTLVTVAWPEWIESVTGLDPDGGNGEAEWLVVAVFAILAAGAALLSRRDYRIARQVNEAEPSSS